MYPSWFPGLEAGRTLGVEPIQSAKELADPEVEHLGPMAYCAYFQHLKKPTNVTEKCKFVGDPESIHLGQGVSRMTDPVFWHLELKIEFNVFLTIIFNAIL